MKKTYEIEMNINAVLFGHSVRHKATYITEFTFDPRFENDAKYEEDWAKPCAAIQALNENWTDIIDQLTPFISRSLDSNSDKSIVESYNRRLLSDDGSSFTVTEVF